MANPYRGEVALTLNDQEVTCRLTLGALAELEAHLNESSLPEMIQRFENTQYTASDVIDLLFVSLRAGGWPGTRDDLANARIEGGPTRAIEAAATLLERAFLPLEAT